MFLLGYIPKETQGEHINSTLKAKALALTLTAQRRHQHQTVGAEFDVDRANGAVDLMYTDGRIHSHRHTVTQTETIKYVVLTLVTLINFLLFMAYYYPVTIGEVG